MDRLKYTRWKRICEDEVLTSLAWGDGRTVDYFQPCGDGRGMPIVGKELVEDRLAIKLANRQAFNITIKEVEVAS